MYLRSTRTPHSGLSLLFLNHPRHASSYTNRNLQKLSFELNKQKEEMSSSNQGYSYKSIGTNSRGNRYCARDYGSGAANSNTYHYSNSKSLRCTSSSTIVGDQYVNLKPHRQVTGVTIIVTPTWVFSFLKDHQRFGY
ncbi:unnamed protein product [Tuber aestivum]|uniref:Uncharacterized protein n=1 Tax=Tuber aestivum TaxID=59557 RepID=A0A292PL10_9PEZI|nr:unnamed protein product [Tuber aestivum]